MAVRSVARAVETVQPLIADRGHALTVSLPDEPIPLAADMVRLTQVFANLLTNAAKFTDPGGRITLTAERTEGGVVVRVADTGVGIPPDVLPTVFDLFVQADRSASRSQGGLGIGLTLVKRLVELHGGTVEAKSDGPGRGSEFTVRLPTARPAVPAEANGRPVAVPSGGRRVLVVDDNVDAADSLSTVLRLWGHQVWTAYDGPAGLAATAEHRPEVVLLDIGLPGMDGHEVARRIRQAGPDRPVLVALTGYGQPHDRRRSAEAGFDHHLVKPADPADLHQLLTGSAGPVGSAG